MRGGRCARLRPRAGRPPPGGPDREEGPVSDQEQRTTPDEVSVGHTEQAASAAGGATRADAHPTGPDAPAPPSAVPSPALAVEPDATPAPLPGQREPELAGPTADAPPPVTPATTALPEPPTGQAPPPPPPPQPPPPPAAPPTGAPP